MPDWIDCRKERLDLANLRVLLSETQPETLGLLRLPNARLQPALRALDFASEAGPAATVADLLETTSVLGYEIDPEDLWALGEEVGYHVAIGPALADPGDSAQTGEDERLGEMRAVFTRLAGVSPAAALYPREAVERRLGQSSQELSAFTNQPWVAAPAAAQPPSEEAGDEALPLAARLRAHLRERCRIT